MKNLTVVLTTVSILFWWEIPALCLIFSLINIFIAFVMRQWSVHYKVITMLSLMVIVLCVWNWDLHVGMRIIDWLLKMEMKRYSQYLN